MSLKVIEAKKNNTFTRLQGIYELTKRVSDPQIKSQFLVKAKTISLLRNEFVEALQQYHELMLKENDKYVVKYDALNSFDDMYEVINALYEDFEKKNTQKLQSAATNSTPVVKPRLPKLNIPDFTGKQEEWPAFYQLFKSLIDDDKTLTKLEKITYLVSHLQGTAKSLCQGIIPIEENYDSLLKALVDRFEDKRVLASTYIDKLLNFKPLSQESEKGLHLFLENFVEATNGLKQLRLTDLTDFIFVHIALKKIDPYSAKQFEMSCRNKEIPTFESLVTFVKEQAKILGRTQRVSGNPGNRITGPENYTVQKKLHNYFLQNSEENSGLKENKIFSFSKQTKYCRLCSQPSHQYYSCAVFKKLPVPERWSVVKANQVCFNCLSPNTHNVATCKSKIVCAKCKRKHHSLLHYETAKTKLSASHNINTSNSDLNQVKTNSDLTFSDQNKSVNDSVNILTHHSASESNYSPSNVLLATATILVCDKQNNTVELRALIDPGSQTNFITREKCDILGLEMEDIDLKIKGIGKMQIPVRSRVTFKFHSKYPPFVNYLTTAIVIDHITERLPMEPVDVSLLRHLKNLPLADDQFLVPAKVDVLLGAEIFPLIAGVRKIFGPPHSPVALESSLGYLLMGKCPISSSDKVHSFCLQVDKDLGETMSKFWSLEEIPKRHFCTEEEKKCEEIFKKTYQRLEDGKFAVALPFRKPADLLGPSKIGAVTKFLSLERRLLNNPTLHHQYNDVMNGHFSDKFISQVHEDFDEGLGYFMPHHGVIKPESVTTPLRIVFNASAKTQSGFSLNDLLHVGPKLQNDVFDILLNFRLFPYCLTADISKMYLQIWILPNYRQYQRIIWRSSAQEELKTYELNTVTFGVASSPYLAQRVIQELTILEENKYPLASKLACRDIYVDDVVASVASKEDAVDHFHELIGMFRSGGFHLTKWSTNVPEINALLANSENFSDISFEKSFTKVLGMIWRPDKDEFHYSVIQQNDICTKRSILSVIARMYDPLGLLSPVIIVAKLIMKDLWLQKIDWDEPPPNELLQRWKRFETDLPLLTRISIPRHSLIMKSAKAILVGFADASEKAYGAVIYVIVTNPDGYMLTRLLCAKSKVAPIKIVSIPRLELQAALLLSILIKHVIEVYRDRYEFNETYAFTDSSVVLHWINASPAKWKVFVANRVQLIQENIPVTSWKHVPGSDNPADILTRGLSPEELLNSTMWFFGPSWLSNSEKNWPKQPPNLQISSEVSAELRQPTCFIATVSNDVLDALLERCSSLNKLLRSTAYVFRFIKRRKFLNINVEVEEFEEAERYWIRYIQLKHFPDVFQDLKNNKSSSRFRELDIYEEDNLLRVGGRIEAANISYDQRHPFLLPKNNRFVHLLIANCHIQHAHAGPHFMFSFLRLKYWIVSARNLIRGYYRKCNVCFKTKPKPVFPKMAPLPYSRLRKIKPFTRTGIDYAGPFFITLGRRRGIKSQKAYLCIFVCLAVKAVHLELASDLTTPCFIAAFKRFISRRGPCLFIQSDCGLNFVGANKEFKELQCFVNSSEYSSGIASELTPRRIEWHFNPPGGPHFGGIWESNIKSVKTHLKKVIGTQILTYEELNTVLVQIEAILNSRPLCVLSDDVRAPTPLTPAHFLTLGSTLEAFPSQSVVAENIHYLTRYKLVDNIVQNYWKRWSQEYLQSLQARRRWSSLSDPIAEGTVVIMINERSPPLKWPLGKIEKLFPGNDGITRVVSIRTADGVYVRPVVKVCPLPTQ